MMRDLAPLLAVGVFIETLMVGIFVVGSETVRWAIVGHWIGLAIILVVNGIAYLLVGRR